MLVGYFAGGTQLSLSDLRTLAPYCVTLLPCWDVAQRAVPSSFKVHIAAPRTLHRTLLLLPVLIMCRLSIALRKLDGTWLAKDFCHNPRTVAPTSEACLNCLTDLPNAFMIRPV